MVDTFVEETNPADPNQTMYNGSWEPMKIVHEEIRVKGEAAPRVVEALLVVGALDAAGEVVAERVDETVPVG
jgi:acyl-homoserine lactone acylase PvdQ